MAKQVDAEQLVDNLQNKVWIINTKYSSYRYLLSSLIKVGILLQVE